MSPEPYITIEDGESFKTAKAPRSSGYCIFEQFAPASPCLRNMSSPKTFNLPNSDPPVPVRLLTSEVDERQVLEFAPLSNWAANLLKTFALQHEDPHHQYHEDPYVLRSIDVQNADFSPNGLESLKAKAEVSNGKGERLPGITFLRGHYVSIMVGFGPVKSLVLFAFVLETTLLLTPGSVDHTRKERMG